MDLLDRDRRKRSCKELAEMASSTLRNRLDREWPGRVKSVKIKLVSFGDGNPCWGVDWLAEGSGGGAGLGYGEVTKEDLVERAIASLKDTGLVDRNHRGTDGDLMGVKGAEMNIGCVGVFSPPPRGKLGEEKFGFTGGQRVKVKQPGCFSGWHGHVRSFDDQLVAVDLDEPPEGHTRNGQWFRPEELEAA